MRAWIVAVILVSSSIARAGGGAAISGDVLVWNDATLYVEPADDAPTLTVQQFDRTKLEKLVGHVVPMRVVGHHGDFLEVEAVGDGQCVGSTLAADHVAQLRVFVKQDALAPVLTKSWQRTFDDGSRVALGAGEPVLPLDAGGVAFRVDGVVLHADVPAASIGRAYRAITPAPLVPGHATVQLRAGTVASIAGQTYTAPAKAALAHAAAAIEHPRKDQTRFPLRTRCGELDVVVADDAVAPYQALTDRRFLPLGDTGYLIPKGTPLATRAGRRAGIASTDIAVPRPANGATTACFEAAVQVQTPGDLPIDLDIDLPGTLELCAPASAVRDVR